MWHFTMFKGDERESVMGAFLFEVQNRLIPCIGYTILQSVIDKYMYSPLSRLYLTPSEINDIRDLKKRRQYGVTSDDYNKALGAVFRYKALSGEIDLSLFEKPITETELHTFWKRHYSY